MAPAATGVIHHYNLYRLNKPNSGNITSRIADDEIENHLEHAEALKAELLERGR